MVAELGFAKNETGMMQSIWNLSICVVVFALISVVVLFESSLVPSVRLVSLCSLVRIHGRVRCDRVQQFALHDGQTRIAENEERAHTHTHTHTERADVGLE